MAQFKENAFRIFEDTYLKLVSKPTIDMDAQEIEIRSEVMHDITLKMLNMETANMQELQTAMAAEGDQMQMALTALKQATENTDSLLMLQAIDQSLQIMSSFFLFLV